MKRVASKKLHDNVLPSDYDNYDKTVDAIELLYDNYHKDMRIEWCKDNSIAFIGRSFRATICYADVDGTDTLCLHIYFLTDPMNATSIRSATPVDIRQYGRYQVAKYVDKLLKVENNWIRWNDALPIFLKHDWFKTYFWPRERVEKIGRVIKETQ